MTGEEFEQAVEDLLNKNNRVHTWEQKQMAYGHKASKGKCDFIIETDVHAIECKVISDLSLLSLPGINPKTRKPYSSPKIKTHQLAFLRRFKGIGWLLIHESNSNTFYALTMHELDMFLEKYTREYNKLPRSLKGIDEYKIDLEEFIGGLK